MVSGFVRCSSAGGCAIILFDLFIVDFGNYVLGYNGIGQSYGLSANWVVYVHIFVFTQCLS